MSASPASVGLRALSAAKSLPAGKPDTLRYLSLLIISTIAAVRNVHVASEPCELPHSLLAVALLAPSSTPVDM